jgi:hypothetical protein
MDNHSSGNAQIAHPRMALHGLHQSESQTNLPLHLKGGSNCTQQASHQGSYLGPEGIEFRTQARDSGYIPQSPPMGELIMTQTQQLIIPEIENQDRLTYILGGNCTFTICSKKTNKSFTYKIKSATADKNFVWSTNNQDRTRFFVKLLTGPDNSNDFTYICSIDNRGNSPIISAKNHQDSRVVNFKWVFLRMLKGNCESFDFLPSTKCGRCGRKLTVPESITTGFGPECAGKI